MMPAMNCRKFVFLVIVLAACSAAHAKGIFQAEGKIAELQRDKDAITFRFVGWISFGYATAPDDHPKRRWKDISWDAADIAVRVGDWTQRYKPAEKADRPDAEQIHATLSELVKSGRPIGFSLDNPSLSFSNKGQLVRASGTYIYAGPRR